MEEKHMCFGSKTSQVRILSLRPFSLFPDFSESSRLEKPTRAAYTIPAEATHFPPLLHYKRFEED